MRADNSRHLTDAATVEVRKRWTAPKRRSGRCATLSGTLTVAEFRRAARVSRFWLYTQPAIPQELSKARPAAGPTEPTAERATDRSLLNRLQAAHERNRELTAEITELRERIASLYGRLRDVDLHGTADQRSRHDDG